MLLDHLAEVHTVNMIGTDGTAAISGCTSSMILMV